MTKSKTVFRCNECGAESPKWAGRCADCGEWNTMSEERSATLKGSSASTAVARTPVDLGSVSTQTTPTRPTRVPELDRVLGGGITSGSVTLLGGEPGIGKSTLVLQLCASLALAGDSCLVVTGEESAEQVARRAERLKATVGGVSLLAETDLETILATVDKVKPKFVVIDSVQTMLAAGLTSAAGTVSQVRECAQALTSYAKANDVAMLLVGHVTKEGALAGPRALEHVVDTVLEFEGDRHHGLRMLRAVKHRFGSTDEVGVLEMTELGLRSVPDASGLFLEDRRGGIGSVVVPALQGRRPMLVELQSLIVDTKYPPRRVAHGIDSGRLALVLAVLRRHATISVGDDDAYASVVGGVRLDDPGTDLGLALSIASSKRNIAIPADVVAIGELGLGGEVRNVGHVARRLNEAARMGFARAIVPEGCPDGPAKLRLVRVSGVSDAVAALQRMASAASSASGKVRAR